MNDKVKKVGKFLIGETGASVSSPIAGGASALYYHNLNNIYPYTNSSPTAFSSSANPDATIWRLPEEWQQYFPESPTGWQWFDNPSSTASSPQNLIDVFNTNWYKSKGSSENPGALDQLLT